jgi:fructose-1,6-bisphosphatase I
MNPTASPVSLTRYLIEEQREGRIGPNLRLLIEERNRRCLPKCVEL